MDFVEVEDWLPSMITGLTGVCVRMGSAREIWSWVKQLVPPPPSPRMASNDLLSTPAKWLQLSLDTAAIECEETLIVHARHGKDEQSAGVEELT